ncbi:MAG: hypothetical protein AAGF23_11045, partial [Acidobacteriota bacterium]
MRPICHPVGFLSSSVSLFFGFFVLASAAVPPAAAQAVTVWTEDFADDSGFTKTDGLDAAVDFFADGGTGYFGIGDGATGGDFDGDTPPDTSGFPFDPGNFLAAADLDAAGATLPLTLTWDPIDISSFAELEVELVISAPNCSFDPSDFVRLHLFVDGESQGSISYLTDGDSDDCLRLDSDGDGVGNSPSLGDFVSTQSQDFLGGGYLVLVLEVSADEADELVGLQRLTVNGLPSVDWTAGTGDFFDGGAWSGGSVPNLSLLAHVRNGGAARADSSATGGAAVAAVDLTVGDQSGGGALLVENTDVVLTRDLRLCTISEATPVASGAASCTGTVRGQGGGLWLVEDLEFLSASVEGTADVELLGELALENVGAMQFGDDAVIGSVDAVDSAQIRTSGSAAFVGFEFWWVDGELETGTHRGSGLAASVDTEVSLRLEDIEELEVGQGVSLGSRLGNFGDESLQIDVAMVDIPFAQVGDVEIFPSFSVLDPAQRTAAQAVWVLDAVTMFAEGLDVQTLDSDDEVAEFSSEVEIRVVDSDVDLAEDAFLGILTGDSTWIDAVVSTQLDLEGSVVEVGDQFSLGVQGAGVVAARTARLTLDAGSYLGVGGTFLTGEPAVLELGLDGVDPVDPSEPGVTGR